MRGPDRLLIPILMVIVTGCAATPSPPTEYLLRPPLPETDGHVRQAPDAALGRVSVPPYLDRQGIVLETGDQRLQVARNHRWAEPLSRSLRRMLQVGISRASGRAVGDTRSDTAGARLVIDVDIHRLHGSVDGQVILAADWQLRDAESGQVADRYRVVRSTLTAEGGYDALVRAHVTLLDELSTAIAETLDAAP